MFVIVELEDFVKINPHLFKKDRLLTIKKELCRKYSNKVIKGVGLGITVYDIVSTEEAYVYQGDGALHIRLKFSFVYFQPHIGEILVGRVSSCSKSEGVRVSLEFFDDVIIPPSLMQAESGFDDEEQLFYWEFEETKLFIDLDEVIRFKVSDIEFNTPQGSAFQGSINEKENRPCIQVKGSIQNDGLGLTSWWAEAEEEAEDMDMEES
eukprot:GCRY01003524.1.p1 GENE.GCRY01003524.1~~GCRY01003524.1.p1  ORF type:complete len:208 (+),score=32.82 GCRY01003524.1:188-811(+)